MRNRHRKKFEVERDNHERWMVSYADFITLLFAFFVVMYAISVINQNKYQRLADSLGSAFGTIQLTEKYGTAESEGTGQRTVASLIKPFPAVQARNEKWRREREAMTAMALDVSQALAPLIKQGNVRVVQNHRGIRIDIGSSILFASGSADLEIDALPVLLEVAGRLVGRPNAIQVEGHTDDVPIRNYLFFSNWELSAARASSVVRLLEQNGIEAERLGVVGYGSSRPVSGNDTEEGREQNRRVSIMVLYAMPERADEGAEIRAKS